MCDDAELGGTVGGWVGGYSNSYLCKSDDPSTFPSLESLLILTNENGRNPDSL